MQGRTHLAIGLAGYVAMTHGFALPGLLAAGFGSLLPDIDHPNSMLSRRINPVKAIPRSILLILAAIGFMLLWEKDRSMPLWIPEVIIAFAFIKHRGITHSLVGLGLVALIGYFIFPLKLKYVLLGYALHLAADMTTDSGIQLFWPLDKHIGLTLLKTGSFISNTIEFGIILLLIRFVFIYL